MSLRNREFDGHQDLTGLQYALSRTGAKVFRRHLSAAIGSHDMGYSAHGYDRRDGIATGRGVAKVPTQAGPALDLYSAYQRGGINEPRVDRRDFFVLVDLIAGDRGPNGKSVLGAVAQLVKLGNPFGVYDKIQATASGS